ncbi:MAG: polysaccharide deacetylase family protein [Sneathiella sp.]|uniref:polysaccharide deacetylase family protein n=1 Tax=Sneathiella sp. TaxID=1964365 RepID=UPI003003A453
MSIAGKFIEKLDRNIARYACVKSGDLVFEQPVVSFTFDDCARTAITVGGEMLKDKGVSGTFYLCGGLTNGFENELPCQTEEDLAYLVESGHELASHLYNHKRCADLTGDQLALEIGLSKNYINSIIGTNEQLSFSYPFGSVNLRAKRMVSEQFLTGRGINPGLNVGRLDLSCLKAYALYEDQISAQKIAFLIDMAVKKKGWLIFYTHDVQTLPSPYGVTPKTLEYAADYALQENCEIRSVAEVMNSFR